MQPCLKPSKLNLRDVNTQKRMRETLTQIKRYNAIAIKKLMQKAQDKARAEGRELLVSDITKV